MRGNQLIDWALLINIKARNGISEANLCSAMFMIEMRS